MDDPCTLCYGILYLRSVNIFYVSSKDILAKMPSYYSQFFWKALELGAIPDFFTRYKIKSGLQQILTELNGDGNIETHQQSLNEFIEEIKTMVQFMC